MGYRVIQKINSSNIDRKRQKMSSSCLGEQQQLNTRKAVVSESRKISAVL